MDAALQRRIQRYGWDRAADRYEPLWAASLAPGHAAMLDAAALRPGERVLDVACGTGVVTAAAAQAVGPGGDVLGVDLSARMVDAARARRVSQGAGAMRVERMDAEALDLPDAGFDVALCAFGLMYLPDPEAALREMRRVLRPGGRVAVSIWGARARCGWAALFPIVDAEVASEVCPMFFRLGEDDALSAALAGAGFDAVVLRRLSTELRHVDGEEACDAAFVGGPVALAWSRLDEAARARARASYLSAIAPWRDGDGFAVPGEFVIGQARRPEGR